MSLKFEKETIRHATETVPGGLAHLPRDGPLPGTSGKHPFAEAVGTAITGGKKNAGTRGYLMVRWSLFDDDDDDMVRPAELQVIDTILVSRRLISTNWKGTLYEPRCSLPALSPAYKSSSPRG